MAGCTRTTMPVSSSASSATASSLTTNPDAFAAAMSSWVMPEMPSQYTWSKDTDEWKANPARIAALAAASCPSTSAVGSASA